LAQVKSRDFGCSIRTKFSQSDSWQNGRNQRV